MRLAGERAMVKLFVGVSLLAGAVAAGGWWWQAGGEAGLSLRTAPVERGNLTVTLTATGTLEPEEVVDVGAQVAGMIKEFGRDAKTGRLINYGSVVEPGTVLARIDDALYREEVELAVAALGQAKAQVRQAELTVNQNEANVRRAEADLALSQARSGQAVRDRDRSEKMRVSSAISVQQLDAAVSLADQALAQTQISEAALAQAQATLETSRATLLETQARVASAEAQLRKTQTNLGYTTIASPIHGVIIDRRVNIGQTVVSSLNAPSLFLIAKDLRRLEIWASVNEADIGQVRVGQRVQFTVDAHPDRAFVGEVSQIRLNATMTQNVVTYTVVITVDNDDGTLLPYLTANLQFEVERKSDVLLVPSAALRWTPRPERIHPDHRQPAEKPEGGRRSKSAGAGRGKGTLWVANGNYVRPIVVAVGATDGQKTEVSGDAVSADLPVAIGEARTSDAAAKTVNPFQPQIFNRRTRGGG